MRPAADMERAPRASSPAAPGSGDGCFGSDYTGWIKGKARGADEAAVEQDFEGPVRSRLLP